jgi:hypothetical protein
MPDLLSYVMLAVQIIDRDQFSAAILLQFLSGSLAVVDLQTGCVLQMQGGEVAAAAHAVQCRKSP